MNEKIIEILHIFQDAYTKKDVSIIDTFMELFDRHDLIIFGTGMDEICINDTQYRALFLSDWTYWGDYAIDFNQVDIKHYPSFSYVNVAATLTYTFKDDDQTYERFLGFVEENIEQGQTHDFMDVLHYLSHLLHQRDQTVRAIQFPMMTSFVFSSCDDQVKINRLMFQMLHKGLYKDVRFEDVLPYQRAFEQSIDTLRSLNHQSDIKLSLLAFDNDVKVINQQGIHLNRSIGHNIQACFDDETNLEIFDASQTHLKSPTHIFFTAYGTLKKKTSKAQMELDLKDHIKEIIGSNLSPKDKLFKIRRDIAHTYKEMALGFDFTWPIRLHGIIEKKQTWVIKHLHIADPFNIILEDKYI